MNFLVLKLNYFQKMIFFQLMQYIFPLKVSSSVNYNLMAFKYFKKAREYREPTYIKD